MGLAGDFPPLEFVRVENRWSCWGASWHGVGVEGRSQALPPMRGCAPHRDWSWPWPPLSNAGPARGKGLAGSSDGTKGIAVEDWPRPADLRQMQDEGRVVCRGASLLLFETSLASVFRRSVSPREAGSRSAESVPITY
nr:uncharacterized protein LOC109767271 [Aegilops tauschii subsp. strangulata]